MKNNTEPFVWGHSRRYNSYSHYFKKTFGERIQKVTIDAGFTCPNRDGTKGYGGCFFCNNDSFSPSYCTPQISISEQIQRGIDFHQVRYKGASKYLAYFQSFSNTYDTLENLKKKYSQIEQHSNIVGIIVGTRPDCIDSEKLSYFKELSKKYYVAIEYGIESCYDETLKNINRGHTFQDSINAIEKTAKYGIKTGAHIIFGLPCESRQMMLDQAAVLSELPLHTIKFHQLQITKGTRFETEYKRNPDKFDLFTLEEYIDFIVHFTEMLNPNIVIERFASESPPHIKIAPDWNGMRYDHVLNRIEKKMEEKNTWQGKSYN